MPYESSGRLKVTEQTANLRSEKYERAAYALAGESVLPAMEYDPKQNTATRIGPTKRATTKMPWEPD